MAKRVNQMKKMQTYHCLQMIIKFENNPMRTTTMAKELNFTTNKVQRYLVIIRNCGYSVERINMKWLIKKPTL
jgi:hypothetical protein